MDRNNACVCYSMFALVSTSFIIGLYLIAYTTFNQTRPIEEKHITRLVSNNSIITGEKWIHYKPYLHNRICRPKYFRIDCDREIIGYECYKYEFVIPIYFNYMLCKSNTNKTVKYEYYKYSSDVHTYSIERPYIINLKTRELFVDPKNVSDELLNNFFKFNQTILDKCNTVHNIYYVWHPNSNIGHTTQKVCSGFDKLIERNITYVPIYESVSFYIIEYNLTILFFSGILLCWCAIIHLGIQFILCPQITST